MSRGGLPLLPPDKAERPYSPAEMMIAEKLYRKAIVGTADQVVRRLDWSLSRGRTTPRQRSYELWRKLLI